MRSVTMTLFCPPIGDDSSEGFLHFRPAETLAEVRRLFRNTEVHIHADKKNRSSEFLKQRPTAIVDPGEYYFMTIALFKHEESVELEVSGRNEELAATLVKTTFEHMDLEREELLLHLIQASETVEDSDRGPILAEAKQRLSRLRESKPIVARLNHRLHNWTVPVFPELVKYFECPVVFLYQLPSGLSVRRRVAADDPAFVLELLADALPKGTPITIDATGQKREETLEIFRGVIENLSEIEYWIKQRGLNISDPELVRELVDLVRARAKEQTTIATRSCIHKLLSCDSIVLNQSACSKDEVIQQLATVHAPHVHIADTKIYDSVWNREEDGCTLWPGGVALPHARMANGPNHVRLAVGVYRTGVKWITGPGFCPVRNNEAFVVFMFLCGPEAQDEYVDYLGQLARLFREPHELVGHLRDAQDASQVIHIVRSAENALSGRWVSL